MVLYTQPSCPQCRAVHILLDSKKISYEEIQDIDVMKSKGIDHTPTLELDDGTLLKARALFDFINNAK